MSATAVHQVLDRLRSVRRAGPDRWMAQCPAHTDKTASLSIRLAHDGQLLVHDFGAGCRFEEVVRALGLRPRDLGPSGPPPTPGTWHPRPRGLSDEAREDILALWRVSDHIRRCAHRARAARAWATRLGEADPRSWVALALAATLESRALAAEANLDEAMRGRIA